MRFRHRRGFEHWHTRSGARSPSTRHRGARRAARRSASRLMVVLSARVLSTSARAGVVPPMRRRAKQHVLRMARGVFDSSLHCPIIRSLLSKWHPMPNSTTESISQSLPLLYLLSDSYAGLNGMFIFTNARALRAVSVSKFAVTPPRVHIRGGGAARLLRAYTQQMRKRTSTQPQSVKYR